LAIHNLDPEATSRGARMLRTALGPSIARWLDDAEVVEVMLNRDGRLWIDRLASGLIDTGERLSAWDGERIVRLVAHHVGTEVHSGSPRVSAELPESGERFEGLLPPVVGAPTFAIRKPAVAVFTLDDYVVAGIMKEKQAGILCAAVRNRLNILVAGGTSTGKTTLTNALLAEVAKTADRVVLIEDTRELQCQAPNLVALRTKDGVASLSDLVRSSLRLRPDRIPIGEVRGAEALDLLKAWGTGHPGGIGTIHAGSALGSLRRMEQLIQEAVITVPRALIADTIQLIAVLAGRGSERRLAELACVEALGSDGDYVLRAAGDQLHRDLLVYAEALARETDQSISDPAKLIAPMLERFMATDRAFVKARRAGQLRSAGNG
jgi:type IV secretion system protein VirB11